jgi:hypothetical protein
MLGRMGERDRSGRRVLAKLGRHEILLAEVVVRAIQLAVFGPLVWVSFGMQRDASFALYMAAFVGSQVSGHLLRRRLELIPPLDPPLSAWKRPLTAWKRWWSGPHAGAAGNGHQTPAA